MKFSAYRASAAFMAVVAIVHIVAVFPADFSDQSLFEAAFALPALLAVWLLWRKIWWVAAILIVGLIPATLTAFANLGDSTIPDSFIYMLILANIGAWVSAVLALITRN